MSAASENAFLLLLFNNTAWANVGNAGGLQPSTVPGSLYVALHSSDPSGGSDQTANEISYTGYGRVGVARDGSHWTVSSNQVSNTASIQFGSCTLGSATATYFSVGVGASGTTAILFSGQLSASRSISAGITPLFNAGALTGTAS
jgi:hypothetical protein